MLIVKRFSTGFFFIFWIQFNNFITVLMWFGFISFWFWNCGYERRDINCRRHCQYEIVKQRKSHFIINASFSLVWLWMFWICCFLFWIHISTKRFMTTLQSYHLLSKIYDSLNWTNREKREKKIQQHIPTVIEL